MAGMHLLTAATLVVTCVAAQVSSPNVVILYTDDMVVGDLGCYGATDIRTPNIDALARAGVRLANYYSAAPICAPSRAALLTGRYPPARRHVHPQEHPIAHRRPAPTASAAQGH